MSNRMKTLVVLAIGGVFAWQLNAATIVGPSPYLTAADAPAEFTAAGGSSESILQDFETVDGPWEVGFSVDVGRRIGPNHVSGAGPVTDSVDGDDSTVDGNGLMGSSWYIPDRTATITFDSPVRAAGFVLTDADPAATTFVLEAFDADGNSLVQQTFEFNAEYLDDLINGTTAEDRFFGVIPAAAGESIKSISMAINAGAGIEIDHVQNFQVPEPAAAVLMWAGSMGLLFLRRRR